ncbi:MAG: hypothetical protein KGK44_02180 [Gammaproteobacteria bacterium]|nr:hypothetical protein [Gammaproteobacteria bacterium]
MAKKLVVKHHRPHQVWLGTGIIFAAAIFLITAAYFYGESRAGYDRQAAAKLQDSVKALDQKNAQLQEQIITLQRERDVDHMSYQQIQRNLETQQSKLLNLQEELAFYKGIVSPVTGEQGLRVQSLKFTSGGAPRLYHYHLVLIQVRTKEFRVTGSVEMKIYGAEQGKPVILDAHDIAPKGKASLDFAFQYFENLEGDAIFPNGFTPGRVEVTILENGHPSVQQNFTWQNVFG